MSVCVAVSPESTAACCVQPDRAVPLNPRRSRPPLCVDDEVLWDLTGDCFSSISHTNWFCTSHKSTDVQHHGVGGWGGGTEEAAVAVYMLLIL